MNGRYGAPVVSCGKDYELVETELMEAFSRFSIYEYITPVNLSEKEAAFFEFNIDPTFEYAVDEGKLVALEKWVRGLPIRREDGCWYFLARARDAFLRELALAKSIGSKDFEKHTSLYVPPPSDEEVAAATAILMSSSPKNPDDARGKGLASGEVAARFEEELSRLGMRDWRVYVDKSVAKARVEASRKRLVIKAGEWFSEKETHRLIAHEIWGHALRAESGRGQPARILGTEYLGGDATDEGIALHLEMAAGVWRGPLAAARHVVAVRAARGGSFVGIFKAIRRYTKNDREAFTQAARVKRGLRDTSKPGGWTKDVIYFRGLREVQRYLSKADYFDLECLYVGKFPLSDCATVREQMRAGMLRTPSLLPPPFTRERYKDSLRLMRAAYETASPGTR